MENSLNSAKTHNDLMAVVDAYLSHIGEIESSVGEAFEETAERLDDDFMRLAAEKWWQLA